MKSVKMMSAIAVCLTVGAIGCQVPVDEEEPLVERDVSTLLEGGEQPHQVSCTSRIRGEGRSTLHHDGLVLAVADPCQAGTDLTFYMRTGDGAYLFDGAELQGELLLPDGGVYGVTGWVEEGDFMHEFELRAFDASGRVSLEVQGAIGRDEEGDEVRYEAYTYWYE